MRIYFVVDILDGRVVRALRGERERYYPISKFSKIVDRDDPMRVVEVVMPRYLYVADLNRITGRGNNLETIEMLAGRVEHLIADCGFKKAEEIESLNFTPVLGTETFDVTQLGEIETPAFVSVDVMHGRLLDVSGRFEFESLMDYLNSFDLLGVIVLTLDRVGTCSLDLGMIERAVELSENPIFAGGGVGSFDDLIKLKEIGCKGVLISTAIHTGSIGLDVVRRGYI